VAEIGRGGVPEVAAPAPLVIEKVVYVEKPAPVKKPRPTHLRAVPATLHLPFFDEPVSLAPAPEPVARVVEPVQPAAQPVAIEAPVELTPVVVEEAGMAAEDRMRLEELLDELTGLKARLQSARAA
jgi:hypothetical protein